jgi:hypothetical protein
MICDDNKFVTFESDFNEKHNCNSIWQLDKNKLYLAREMTEEAKQGRRRPMHIVVATDRFCPLGDIVDSIILSTEGTGLLQAKINGRPIIRFNLLLNGVNATKILYRNDKAIKRLQKSGVEFRFEEYNSSSDISKLNNARECALNFIRYLSKEDNPIILWLDDDLAFDTLTVSRNQVHLSHPWSYFHEVWYYHENLPEIDIGLGDVTGAPPLPASSTLLTNLIDLEAHFCNIPTRDDNERWDEVDYYYDLSDEPKGSTKPWPISQRETRNTEDILWSLIEVGSLARPLVANSSTLAIKKERYIRGGNTIIFNSHWLDVVDNPKIPRRGDTIWALKVRKGGGSLGHFPIPLRHIRDPMTEGWTPQGAKSNWLRRLKVDIIGASFQRWYANPMSTLSPEEILVNRCKKQLQIFESAIGLTTRIPEDIGNVMNDFIASGKKLVAELIEDPAVFKTYHECIGNEMAQNQILEVMI